MPVSLKVALLAALEDAACSGGGLPHERLGPGELALDTRRDASARDPHRLRRPS